MKQKRILFGLLGICIFFGLNSCAVEDLSVIGDDFEIPRLTDENTIQFTVEAGGNLGELQMYAGGGRMAVEWGDGRLQKIEDPSAEPVSYKYGNLKSYRVRVWAEELDYCSVSSFSLPLSNVHIGYLPRMRNLDLNSITGNSKLDISSSCPNLELINIGNMPDLESVDISGCKNLKKVYIYTNPKLTALDLRNQLELEELHCSGNAITKLSLKGLRNLKEIDCSFNESLSIIEYDDNNVIGTLYVSGCNFRSMSFINRMSSLRELNCNSNKLTELDLSEHESICYVDCSNNKISSLKIPSWSYILQRLDCRSNMLGKDALNSLFEDLKVTSNSHYENPRYIYYFDNPGENTCNREVPLQKGWRIEDRY